MWMRLSDGNVFLSASDKEQYFAAAMQYDNFFFIFLLDGAVVGVLNENIYTYIYVLYLQGITGYPSNRYF